MITKIKDGNHPKQNRGNDGLGTKKESNNNYTTK